MDCKDPSIASQVAGRTTRLFQTPSNLSCGGSRMELLCWGCLCGTLRADGRVSPSLFPLPAVNPGYVVWSGLTTDCPSPLLQSTSSHRVRPLSGEIGEPSPIPGWTGSWDLIILLSTRYLSLLSAACEEGNLYSWRMYELIDR